MEVTVALLKLRVEEDEKAPLSPFIFGMTVNGAGESKVVGYLFSSTLKKISTPWLEKHYICPCDIKSQDNIVTEIKDTKDLLIKAFGCNKKVYTQKIEITNDFFEMLKEDTKKRIANDTVLVKLYE